MDTRSRARRTAPSEPASSTRTTRGSARAIATASVNPGPATHQTEIEETRGLSGDTKKLAIPFDEIPRRYARRERQGSFATSVATRPTQQEDVAVLLEDDMSSKEEESPNNDEVEEVASQEGVEDGAGGEDEDEDEADDPEEEHAMIEVMRQGILDLDTVTDNLMKLIKDHDLTPLVFKGRRHVKAGMLSSAREPYEDLNDPPFAKWRDIDQFDPAAHGPGAALVLSRANIVTALDGILEIQRGEHQNLPFLLKKLNNWFPSLFTFDSDFHAPKLTLDLRTWYFITVLERLAPNSDSYAHLVSVFCEPDPPKSRDHAQLLMSGPFRSLGGDISPDRLEELCSNRTTEIVSIIKKQKKSNGALQMKKHFPLKSLLDDLESWLTEMYDILKEKSKVSPFETGDAELDDSQIDAESESQPITRLESGEERPSLFSGKASLNHLNDREPSQAPPSNQQAVPASEAPKDYRNHTNDQLLSQAPPSSMLAQGNARVTEPHHQPSPRVLHDPFDMEEDDDEEEDAFETDRRPVNQSKRAAIASNLQSNKRPRIDPAVPASQPLPRIALSESMPPPPLPSSSAPDYAALKQRKSFVTRQARISLGPATARQRHAWSDHDCTLLIELVRLRQASWTTIESNDNSRFEHPRNQQAYRDKARNMKVDYLMTDAILPPCFDLVALGKKEINRLVALGKNPHRRESDVDADGRAINTEIDPQTVMG